MKNTNREIRLWSRDDISMPSKLSSIKKYSRKIKSRVMLPTYEFFSSLYMGTFEILNNGSIPDDALMKEVMTLRAYQIISALEVLNDVEPGLKPTLSFVAEGAATIERKGVSLSCSKLASFSYLKSTRKEIYYTSYLALSPMRSPRIFDNVHPLVLRL